MHIISWFFKSIPDNELFIISTWNCSSSHGFFEINSVSIPHILHLQSKALLRRHISNILIERRCIDCPFWKYIYKTLNWTNIFCLSTKYKYCQSHAVKISWKWIATKIFLYYKSHICIMLSDVAHYACLYCATKRPLTATVRTISNPIEHRRWRIDCTALYKSFCILRNLCHLHPKCLYEANNCWKMRLMT